MSDRAAYGIGAGVYDILAGEAIYRIGRVEGVRMLGLRHGDTVLDVGCGTGLNLALLADAVGPTGSVIGLDRSAQMLEVARHRIEKERWSHVRLVEADATDFRLDAIGGRPVDAVISTYAMSVIDAPAAAWTHMRAALRPGGRACIVDMQVPTGRARIFAPLARLACAIGGSDIHAHPWQLLLADGQDLDTRSLRGGHIQVVAGSLR